MKKNIFLKVFFIFISSVSIGQSLDKIVSAKIDSFLINDYQNSTTISAEIYNLTKDSLLFARDEKLLLHPASNMKILTTAAGLLFLKPEYEFVTELFYEGNISGNILKGNLYIKGGFDPDLTSEDLEKFVDVVLDADIETIEGNIYADVSLMDNRFWGNGWMWDDDPGSDFPYLTPLNINDDCVSIEIKPGNAGEKAHVNILPRSLFYTFENDLITDTSKSRFLVTRDWINRKNHFIISGTVNADFEPDTLFRNLAHTNYYAVTLLKEKLYREGINTFGVIDTAQVPKEAKMIANIRRRFDDVIVNLNKSSDNLSAEMTLRALGSLAKHERISAADGIVMVDSLIELAGLDPDNYRIVDGSGVSHYNLISTELIVSVLKYLYNRKRGLYEILKSSFPAAGVDGTLKNRMRKGYAFGNVHAKTGTLSGVSSLSGYLKNAGGEDIVFSIFVQNFVGGANKARNLQNAICEILSGYSE